jgi:type I restriction enzyme S subunit
MNSKGWEQVTLGKVSKDVAYGYTASAQAEEVGPKFLRITDIVSGLNWNTVPYCTIDQKNIKKYSLEVGDIVVARTGATTGSTEIVKEKINAVFASYLIRFKIDEKKADPFYVGYVVKSNLWKEYVQSIIGGSAQPGANAKQFSEFTFNLPPLRIQSAIASILSSLDDKIELNRQTNQTLEAIAQALFKEWFVDFNFPGATGEMQDSELGKIPKGWKVGKVGNVLEAKGGTTPSTKVAEYWDGNFYWATPKDLSGLQSPVLLRTERRITEKGVKQISSGILPKNTLLLSSRAPIGYMAITNIPVSINQGFIAINGKELSNIFLLVWLQQNMDKVVSRANGSTFLEISKTSFKELDIIIPTKQLLEAFDKIAIPIFEQLKNNEEQTQTLIQLRDTLLPKLMKGEISVSQTEKLIAATT